MDGDGYTEFVDHPNAAAHLGAWLALIEIASRRETRGVFTQSPAELPKLLARISRLPVLVFVEAIPRLLALGWIEEIVDTASVSQDGATIAQAGAVLASQDDASRAHAGALPFPSIPFPSIPFPEEGVGGNQTQDWTDGWAQLCEAAVKAGMSFDPNPASELCRFRWRPLDFEQKRSAIAGILARVECGQYDAAQPQFTPTLENYIKGSKWNESLRPRSRDSPRLTKAEQAEVDFKQRLLRKANYGRAVQS